MSKFLNKLSQKKELFVLVMMLEMLHLSIWVDFGSTISRSFMLSHLGLFLIWQPVWRGNEKLSIDNAILFAVFTFSLTIWLSPWLLFFWLVLLIGFISGRVTADRNERMHYTLALGFLILELFFASVPGLIEINTGYNYIFNSLLPLIPLLILVFPGSIKNASLHLVDFIHAITTSMLTSLVAMGTLLNMFLSESSYFAALTQTTVAIGGFILCISWLLTSQTRFSGVSQLWSNYMLNIGTPFEEWLSDLSKTSELELSPDEFLNEAMHKLARLSWIAGIKWEVGATVYDIGNTTINQVDLVETDFKATLYTFSPAGVSLKLHSSLLIKLLHNFYINKKREQELTRQAHLKAIYETGARITHDIKNLLQSLQAITSIISQDTDTADAIVAQRVLKKQLPQLTQRLQLALDKLQTPQIHNSEEVYLKDWWGDLQKRNTHNKILFQADLNDDPTIPIDLFDSVVDNLLENIQTKQYNEGDLVITITLVCNKDNIILSVCDSGSMIPAHISKDLLSNAISSDNGLGIGLYQANKHAEMFGYALSLIDNQPGRVCFELSRNN